MTRGLEFELLLTLGRLKVVDLGAGWVSGQVGTAGGAVEVADRPAFGGDPCNLA